MCARAACLSALSRVLRVEPGWLLLSSEAVSKRLAWLDDTLGIETDQKALQSFVEFIGRHGEQYGLLLNWAKTVVMADRHEGSLHGPDGRAVKQVEHGLILADDEYGDLTCRIMTAASGERLCSAACLNSKQY